MKRQRLHCHSYVPVENRVILWKVVNFESFVNIAFNLISASEIGDRMTTGRFQYSGVENDV